MIFLLELWELSLSMADGLNSYYSYILNAVVTVYAPKVIG